MPQIRKKYETVPGNLIFFCGGRCMMSRKNGTFFLTFGALLLLSTLFFVFEAPFLWREVSPVIPIIAVILFVIIFVTMFRTACTDPGIIPRANEDEAAFIIATHKIEPNLTPTSKKLPTIKVKINKVDIEMKYCITCKFFRPPRVSHCSTCDICVERFDHHCPWIGNCVGRRNYRYFYLFIIALSMADILVFSCSLTHLALELYQQDILEKFTNHPELIVSAILAWICFCSVWSVVGLAGYHTCLITSNQTTNEDIKGTFSFYRYRVRNPYSTHNAITNFWWICCRPQLPSYIDAENYTEKDKNPFVKKGSFKSFDTKTSTKTVELRTETGKTIEPKTFTTDTKSEGTKTIAETAV